MKKNFKNIFLFLFFILFCESSNAVPRCEQFYQDVYNDDLLMDVFQDYTEKQKNVLLSDGRMASSKKEKGAGSVFGNKEASRSLKGAVGARTSSMSKVKWSKGHKTKRRSSGTGEANMYMTSRGPYGTGGVSQDDSRRYGTGKDSSKRKVSRQGLRKRK